MYNKKLENAVLYIDSINIITSASIDGVSVVAPPKSWVAAWYVRRYVTISTDQTTKRRQLELLL